MVAIIRTYRIEMVAMEKIMPGYKAFNGYVFSSVDCDLYNKASDEVLKYQKRGLEIPERVLNERHRLFCIIISAV